MSRAAEDAGEREMPYVPAAVLVPEQDQGTGLFKRFCALCVEGIKCAEGNCRAPTREASSSAKHHMICAPPIWLR